MGKVKGAAFLICARVLQAFAQLVAVPIYISQLGKPGYGVALFALLVGGYLNLLDLGFTIGSQKPLIEAFASNEPERAWRIYRSQFTLTLLVALTALLLMVAIGALFPVAYDGGTLLQSIELFTCAGVFIATNFLHNAISPALLAKEKYGRLSAIGLSQSLICIILSIIAVSVWPNPIAFMAAQALGNVLNLFIQIALLAWIDRVSLLHLCFDREIIKEVTRFGLRAYVTKVWGTFATGSDRVILRVISGSSSLAEYMVSARVVEVAIQFIRPTVDTTLPDLTKAQMESDGAFARLIQRTSLFWLFVGSALFIVPAGFSDPFFTLWLGSNKPESASTIMLLLSVYFALELYFAGLTTAMIAKGQLHRLAPFSIWNAIATVSLTYPAYYFAGLPGIAGMNALIDLMQFIPIIWVIRRYGTPELNLVAQLGRASLILAFGAGVSILGRLICQTSAIQASPWLGLLLGAFAALVFGLFLLLIRLVTLPSSLQAKVERLPVLSKLFARSGVR